jgi:hypothetical protein
MVHREQPAPGLEGHQARPLEGEAALLQDSPGSRIDHPRRRGELGLARIGEEGVDERPGRLRRQALAPMGRAEPIAEMGSAVLGGRPDPDHADRSVGPPLRSDGELQSVAVRVGLPGVEHEPLGILRRIGMRDARRHLRDRFLAGQTRDGLSVREAGPPQPKPPGFQAEHVVTGEVGEHGSAPFLETGHPFRP